MTTSMELYQGDSSDLVNIDVYHDDVLVTDLTGYSGKFSVMRKLGSTLLIDKTMSVVSGSFQAQITPTESQALSVANYIGVVEITNTDLAYKKETHISIAVRKQGY